MADPSLCVVVGVFAGQPDVVLQTAARFAVLLNARLVCAHVDAGRYVVSESIDGQVDSRPIDPDILDEGVEFPAELREHIRVALADSGVVSDCRMLGGDPARAIAHLAEALDAALIVVGTRRPNVRGTLAEFFNGSVAVHLTHRQHRPVLVVPLHATPAGEPLPWQGE